MAKSLRLAALLGLLGLLAGCAEGERTSYRPTVPPAGEETTTQLGAYKVGRPYQIAQVWYYPRADYDYDETGIASWYGPGFHGKETANGEIYDQNAMTAAHRTLPMPSLVKVTNLENGRSIRVRVNDRGPFAHGRIIDLSKRAAELLGFMRQGTAKVRVQILEDESRQLALAAGAGAEVGGSAPTAVPVETVAVQELPAVGGGAAAPAARPAVTQTAAVVPAQEPARLRTATLVEAAPVVAQEPVRRTEIFVQAGAFTQVANAVRLRARLSSLGDVHIAKAMVGAESYYRVRLGPMVSVDQADQTLALLLDNGIKDARVVVD